MSKHSILGFLTAVSQPSLLLISFTAFLRAHFLHRHAHLNAYRAMVGLVFSTALGFATIGATFANFFSKGFGDVAAIVLTFLAVGGLMVLAVLLLLRRTAAAQNHGIRMLMLVPIAMTAALIDIALKPFNHFDASGTTNTITMHILYIIFLFTSAVSGLAIALFMQYTRRKQLEEADKLIAGDKANYDITWLQILTTNPKINDVIDSLAAVVAAWRAELAIFKVGGTPLDRPAEVKLADATLRTMLRISRNATVSSKHTGRPRQQIADVCVLFAQAGAFNDHFQGLVLQWAEGLGGAVVHSSPVKRRARAIEKLHRSYHGDPGWIIDLVRASISFETLDALLWCVQRLVDDPTVAILQVKNRFDPDYNSADSAGYRNLSISFVVVDAVTMGLKVEHHICELQLGLAAIDAFKNDTGHDKYVRWRNMRAE